MDKLWWEEEAELQKGGAEVAAPDAPALTDVGDGWAAFMGRDSAGAAPCFPAFMRVTGLQGGPLGSDDVGSSSQEALKTTAQPACSPAHSCLPRTAQHAAKT